VVDRLGELEDNIDLAVEPNASTPVTVYSFDLSMSAWERRLCVSVSLLPT
jgi:hypothetical protein